jgi:hypothetical protein
LRDFLEDLANDGAAPRVFLPWTPSARSFSGVASIQRLLLRLVSWAMSDDLRRDVASAEGGGR